MTISTLDELEAAIQEMALHGVSLHFGPSSSPLRHGQWFANTAKGENVTKQVRGRSLWDAVNALLGLHDEVEEISLPPKLASVVKPSQTTSLTDLLA